MARRMCAIVLAGVLLAGGASAGPAAEWTVERGDLAPGRGRALVISTDASDTRFSIAGLFRHVSLARVVRREVVRVPYELAFDWQWLTPGRWTLEIHGLGIVVLIGRETIGFYVDDAQLMGTMFEQMPVGDPARPRSIVVRQTAREIVVLVDGRVAGRRDLAGAPAAGNVMLGLRGAPGERTRAAVRSVVVRPVSGR